MMGFVNMLRQRRLQTAEQRGVALRLIAELEAVRAPPCRAGCTQKEGQQFR